GSSPSLYQPLQMSRSPRRPSPFLISQSAPLLCTICQAHSPTASLLDNCFQSRNATGYIRLFPVLHGYFLTHYALRRCRQDEVGACLLVKPLHPRLLKHFLKKFSLSPSSI